MAVAWALLRQAGTPCARTRLGMHVHRGVAGFVSLFMFFYALTALPVATAMTLNYSSPLFLAILLTVLARERPGAKLVGTVLLGFAGVVLLLQPTFAADQWRAGLIGLVSGAISAVAYWNVRELVRARGARGARRVLLRPVRVRGLAGLDGAAALARPDASTPVGCWPASADSARSASSR